MPCALLSDHSYSLNPVTVSHQKNISFDHTYANPDKKRKKEETGGESVDRYPPFDIKVKKHKSVLVDNDFKNTKINNKTFPKHVDKQPPPDRISVLKNVVNGYSYESIQGTKYINLQVPGDGNCFFHCLSLSLHGNFSKTSFYRNLICSHIARNWDIWRDLVSLSHDLSSNTGTLW